MENFESGMGITFMKKKQQLEGEVQTFLQQGDFQGAKTKIDHIATLETHRQKSQSMLGLGDEVYKDTLLLDDTIYQQAVENNNLQVIQLFKTRKLTQQQYEQLREKQYENLFREKEGESAETPEGKVSRIEKIHKVENILSMLDIIQKRFGEEKRDMLAMQIMDFVDSDKKPTDFDLQYLENIEKRVRRYLVLMRKLQSNGARGPEIHTPSIERKEVEIKETQEILMKSRKESIETKRASLIAEMNILNEDMIAKQKKLYALLEDMVNKTHNHDLGFRSNASFMFQFARLIMFPAMADGLPSGIPAEFVKYVQKYGRGDVSKALDTVYVLRDEIRQFKIQIDEIYKKFLVIEQTQEEENVYMSDSSEVFVGNLIPMPINKLASEGLVDMPSYHIVTPDIDATIISYL